ncbi:glutamyl-tRNA reductase [Verrucomicrobia bacterium LW23]|nr:glutamyl-tRNA reductase [Verrucomicrobia bacterium LW23]
MISSRHITTRLVCGGLTFEKAPVALREKAAFTQAGLPLALAEIRKALRLEEAVIVSTCNRVEYFGATTASPAEIAAQWPDFLRRHHGVEENFGQHSFALAGEACVDHLFQLAAGLKSMVVGETEVLGQLKDAYETAHREGSTGKYLNRLFQSCFAAAKAVRTNTGITRGSVSVGSVSVQLAEKIFGSLHGRKVMVIGAGDTSEKTARSLLSRGVHSVIVANRTYERAAALAQVLEGRAVRWDSWENEALDMDIIISSTSAPHYVLTREKLAHLLMRRGGRTLFLIDLAVPRDFEPSINQLDDVYLYDIDDLQSIARTHLTERHSEIARGVDILRPHIERYCTWADRQTGLAPGERPDITAKAPDSRRPPIVHPAVILSGNTGTHTHHEAA